MDPLTAFISGQQGALDVQQQRENLAQSQMRGQQLGMQGQQQQMQFGLQKAQLLGNAIDAVAKLDQRQRMGVVNQLRPELQRFGIALPQMTEDQLTDQALQGYKASVAGFIQNPQQMQNAFQRGQGAIVETPDGGRAFAAEVFDPRTGAIKTEISPIGSQLTSKIGETPEQQSERKIAEEAGKVSAKGEKTRIQSAIDSGVDAIDPVDDIGRSLELLQSVGTGRPEAVLLAAKERLGIEAADEAELKSLLGRSVLAGLKASFGGNPTEGERAALADVESSFGQNGEVNRRLLNNTLTKLERKIDRALFAAEKEGDDFSIKTLMDGKNKITALRNLGVADKPAQPATQQQQAPVRRKYNPQTGRLE